MYKKIKVHLVLVLVGAILYNDIVLSDTKSTSNNQTQNFQNKDDQFYYKQLQDAFQRVKKYYVQEPDLKKMTESAINGMLTSLDPHSSYFNEEEMQDFLEHTKGEFGGIGIEIIPDNNLVKVIAPIDDMPAARAGIIAGDYIVAVNDELVSTLGFNKAVKEMRGTPGTTVTLLVLKENENKPRKLVITREVIKTKPVKAHLEKGDIAYVRITTFNQYTTTELKKAFAQLKSESHDGIKGILLDLRNNPGGLLEQAKEVSEYFIDSGVIVSIKGRTADNVAKFEASRYSSKAPNVPMVVLINNGSASASEIVAGALQDYKRAIIMGTKSFGKGSVQTFMEMGKQGAIKITTAKYYTPKGRSIQADGIEPDIIVELANVEYPKKDKDLPKRFSESSLRNYLKNEQLENNDKTKGNKVTSDKNTESLNTDKSNAKEGKNQTPVPSDDSKEAQGINLYEKDYQFARAYDLLKGLVLVNKNIPN